MRKIKFDQFSILIMGKRTKSTGGLAPPKKITALMPRDKYGQAPSIAKIKAQGFTKYAEDDLVNRYYRETGTQTTTSDDNLAQSNLENQSGGVDTESETKK